MRLSFSSIRPLLLLLFVGPLSFPIKAETFNGMEPIGIYSVGPGVGSSTVAAMRDVSAVSISPTLSVPPGASYLLYSYLYPDGVSRSWWDVNGSWDNSSPIFGAFGGTTPPVFTGSWDTNGNAIVTGGSTNAADYSTFSGGLYMNPTYVADFGLLFGDYYELWASAYLSDVVPRGANASAPSVYSIDLCEYLKEALSGTYDLSDGTPQSMGYSVYDVDWYRAETEGYVGAPPPVLQAYYLSDSFSGLDSLGVDALNYAMQSSAGSLAWAGLSPSIDSNMFLFTTQTWFQSIGDAPLPPSYPSHPYLSFPPPPATDFIEIGYPYTSSNGVGFLVTNYLTNTFLGYTQAVVSAGYAGVLSDSAFGGSGQSAGFPVPALPGGTNDAFGLRAYISLMHTPCYTYEPVQYLLFYPADYIQSEDGDSIEFADPVRILARDPSRLPVIVFTIPAEVRRFRSQIDVGNHITWRFKENPAPPPEFLNQEPPQSIPFLEGAHGVPSFLR